MFLSVLLLILVMSKFAGFQLGRVDKPEIFISEAGLVSVGIYLEYQQLTSSTKPEFRQAGALTLIFLRGPK